MQLNKVDIVVGELLVRRLKLFFKETLFHQHVNSCDERVGQNIEMQKDAFQWRNIPASDNITKMEKKCILMFLSTYNNFWWYEKKQFDVLEFGKGSERRKSLHRKLKKEHQKSKIQNIESLICLIFKFWTTYGVSTNGILA